MKRRLFLATLAAGAVGISGCASTGNNFTEGERQSLTPTVPLTGSDRTYTNCISDVETIQHQNFNGEIPISWNGNTGNVNGIYKTDLERLREKEWYTANGIVSTSKQRKALQYKKDIDGIEEMEEFIESTDLSSNTIIINYWKITEYERPDVEFVKWGKARGSSDGLFDIAIQLNFSDMNNGNSHGSVENMIVTVVRIPDEIERANSLRTGNVERLTSC